MEKEAEKNIKRWRKKGKRNSRKRKSTQQRSREEGKRKRKKRKRNSRKRERSRKKGENYFITEKKGVYNEKNGAKPDKVLNSTEKKEFIREKKE